MVKFCGKKKKEPLCFVTKMVEKGENKQTYGDEIGIVQNINLWMKLISTLNVSVKEKIIQTKFLFLELTMFADLLLIPRNLLSGCSIQRILGVKKLQI